MTYRVYAQRVTGAESAVEAAEADVQLMRALAAGHPEVLGDLYRRYAPLVFTLCAQSVDRATAEELVQEVFLTIWRGADTFDPQQGPFRPWLLRLTHWKILNELRRRRRRPTIDQDDDDEPLERVQDEAPSPEDSAWRSEHESIVRSALADLPPKQREAIALAFLQDMTHEQVARALNVPLGTAKTRIRSGLQLLRLRLAPIAATLLGLALLLVGFRFMQDRLALDREQRALILVTTSDLVPLRLTPASPAVPAGAHANYRGRAGNHLAVLTTELLAPPPPGMTYAAWARHGDRWTPLGTFEPDAAGQALAIVDNAALAEPPDALEITLERTPVSGSEPRGAVVLSWVR
jgi:RNA polymerase sigma-70 factor (ECF subfamily)